MSFTVTTAFVTQFQGVVIQLAQQMSSRLRETIFEQQVTGDTDMIEQLAPTAAIKRTSRHGDSPVLNAQHLRRRVALYDYEWGDLIDKLDEVRLLIDPASKYTQAAGMAMARAQDDEIINAFFATAYTGQAGTTTATWPTAPSGNPTNGTQVAVSDWTYGNGSGNAGLTISKLISAKAALDAAEAPPDDRFIVVGSKQMSNLLATTEATSTDYNAVKALVDGTLENQTFMGFRFKRSERLQVNGSSQTRVPAYHRQAVALGVGANPTFRVSERPDKSYATYVYACMALGGTRMEEGKLVEIICA